MEREIVERKIQEAEKELDKEITPIDFEALNQAIKGWLLIKDEGLIKVITGAVIANKLKADPVWLFIVTASGGTKTELIRGLSKVEGIYPLSDLTAQTFLSGDKNKKDASLLLRLPPNTILTFKDFTTVLTMHRDKRHAILSQLREIFDGHYKKLFGTGEVKEWQGKIGFIAGVTPIIETHFSVHATLGERFIQYRPSHSNVISLAKRAMEISGKEEQMREEIQNAFKNYIMSRKIPPEPILISEVVKDRIAHLSAFCVKARSSVIRDGYSSREIELIPDSELPTRLAKQLITLLSAFLIIDNGEFKEDSYNLICKIGMDTIPQRRKLAMDVLLKANDYLETAEVAIKISYPTNTTRRILEELQGLKLSERKHRGQGYADRWTISETAREFLEKAGYTHNVTPIT